MATTRKKPAPVRNPNEALLTANLPKMLKAHVVGRAYFSRRPMALLVRMALEYQTQNNWKDVPLAQLPPRFEAMLQRWLDDGADPEKLLTYPSA